MHMQDMESAKNAIVMHILIVAICFASAVMDMACIEFNIRKGGNDYEKNS